MEALQQSDDVDVVFNDLQSKITTAIQNRIQGIQNASQATKEENAKEIRDFVASINATYKTNYASLAEVQAFLSTRAQNEQLISQAQALALQEKQRLDELLKGVEKVLKDNNIIQQGEKLDKDVLQKITFGQTQEQLRKEIQELKDKAAKAASMKAPVKMILTCTSHCCHARSRE